VYELWPATGSSFGLGKRGTADEDPHTGRRQLPGDRLVPARGKITSFDGAQLGRPRPASCRWRSDDPLTPSACHVKMKRPAETAVASTT